MNRLYQLKETLPHNLGVIESFDNVELCLVNFNSQDDLNGYIKDNFMQYIESGKLNYFYTKQPQYFHCSIAKNLAHRLGRGEILYNLDGDNFITEENVHRIIEIFDKNENIFLHEVIKRTLKNSHNGTYGRIALTSKNFHQLRGYDENLLGVSQHDIDIIKRLRKLNLCQLNAQSGIKKAILNNKIETMANQKKKLPYLIYSWSNFFLVRWRNILRNPVNPSGMKKLYGELNFKEHLEI